MAYTEDSLWRSRAEFLQGRLAIVTFLQRNGRGKDTVRDDVPSGRRSR
jgi:nuclear transport factor 2 (NTF2) superfamily protein